MTYSLARMVFSQQSYVPVVLSTTKAADVLYGENVIRAHRIDDTNDNTALILRANFSIGIVDPKDGGDDASKLLSFLKNHTEFEHLVLEYGFKLLEDSKLRNLISYVLYRCGYLSRLTVRSAFQSKRSSYNAAQLEERVDIMALIRNDFPELFEKMIDSKGGDKSRWYARQPLK